jgi:hypothetical protein
MSSIIDPVARKRALIEGRKKEVEAASSALTKTKPPTKTPEYIPAEEAANKLRIVFDNSSSMGYGLNSGHTDRMTEAKKGVVEFLRSCTLNKDAVAIHLLNSGYYYKDSDDENPSTGLPACIKKAELTTDLIKLAKAVEHEANRATGGTPLYQRILDTLNSTPTATRIVAFSDGDPNNFNEEEACISFAKKLEVPIDTVYFGAAHESGAEVMKRLATRTGGIYIIFDPAKGVSFKDAFKYLAPVNRLRLMNAEFKAKLERGEIK